MPTINVLVLGCAPQCEPRDRLPPPSDRNRERLCRTFLRMLRRMFPVPAGVEARLTVQVTQLASGVCTRHVVVRFDRTAAARRQHRREGGAVDLHRTVLPPDPQTILPVGSSASGSDGAATASTGTRVDVDRDREHAERQGA